MSGCGCRVSGVGRSLVIVDGAAAPHGKVLVHLPGCEEAMVVSPHQLKKVNKEELARVFFLLVLAGGRTA